MRKSLLLFRSLVLMIPLWISLVQTGVAQMPSDVTAQIQKNTPKPAQNSPNAAGIQKFGDFNVNLYTGIPDISIPLFEIVSGSIKVPIVLKYHATGVRITDQSSWVGLGWSIEAGGQITRSITGKPDESQYLTMTNDYTVDPFGYCTNFNYKEQIALNGTDREPDLFSYSFPGSSGRFFLAQNSAAPIQFPYKAYQITQNSTNYFDIVDTKGMAFRFGANWTGAESARESMNATTGSSVTSGNVTWYLKEIKSPNSDDYVSFKYQTVGTFTFSEIENNITLMDQCNTGDPSSLPCTSYSPVTTFVSTSNSTTQLGIEEIFFKTGKVKFVIGTSRTDLPTSPLIPKRLDRIEVYYKSGSNYILYQTYQLHNSGNFKLASTGADARLKLDSLSILDGANTLVQRYEFAYQTNTFSWDQINSSYKRDLFGFYNGKSNSNLIPQQTIQYQATTSLPVSNLNIGGAINRDADTTYLKQGVLKRITFPTGGYTEFEFEPHKYLDASTTKYGGGLRIKKITKNDGASNQTTLYKYGNNDDGLGHKNFDVRNFHFMNTQYKRDVSGGVNQRQYRVRAWVSNSVVGAGFDDAPVVYSKVTEYPNSGSSIGKTIYEFDNNSLIGDGVFTVQYSNKTWRNKKSWQRGKLTKVSKYDNGGVLKEETVKTYTNIASQNINVGQSGYQVIMGEESGGYFYSCPGSGGAPPYDGMRYMIATISQDVGTYLETGSTTTRYYGSNSLQEIMTSGFNSTYLQQTFMEKQGSSNPTLVRTTYRYPYDIVGSTTSYTGLPDVLKQMLLKNMVAYPVEEYTYVKQGTGSNQYISGQITEYSFPSGTTLYVPFNLYFMETATPSTSYSPMVVTGGNTLTKDSKYKLRMTMSGYDTKGNLTQFSLANGSTNSFIYGYDGSYLIAEATNAALGVIAYTSFETSEKGGWTYSGAEIPVMLGEAKTGEKVYYLNNGSVTKSTLGTNKVSFWARRNTASATTLTINGTAYTGPALDDTWKLVEINTINAITIAGSNVVIDELKVHPLTAQMTTYTMKPLVGITSQIDTKNQGLYYFYDRFGRLETLKNEDGHILKHYEYTYKKQ
ncbi:hypothetical protein JYB64_19395 [Algoriphagus aestuarii]|nr:hypothetical protein [Algoriphagus aestuarii]